MEKCVCLFISFIYNVPLDVHKNIVVSVDVIAVYCQLQTKVSVLSQVELISEEDSKRIYNTESCRPGATTN